MSSETHVISWPIHPLVLKWGFHIVGVLVIAGHGWERWAPCELQVSHSCCYNLGQEVGTPLGVTELEVESLMYDSIMSEQSGEEEAGIDQLWQVAPQLRALFEPKSEFKKRLHHRDYRPLRAAHRAALHSRFQGLESAEVVVTVEDCSRVLHAYRWTLEKGPIGRWFTQSIELLPERPALLPPKRILEYDHDRYGEGVDRSIRCGH